jgi:DNA sulfur modification protein DndD
MIIKSLSIENFQCYSGKLEQNTFEFREGLNVIIGDNGSGKSKLYDAFFWVLYDKIFDSSTRQLIHTSEVGTGIVSDKAKANSEVGGKIVAKVQLKLHNYKRASSYPDEYILERSFTIQKINHSEDYNDPENWKVAANSVTSIEKKDIINFKPLHETDAFSKIVEKLIPTDMGKYLWFQGEQVDSLIDFKNENSLTYAINILSDINYYDSMIEIAKKVFNQAESAYKTELREKSKNENEAEKLTKRQDVLEKLIERDENDLKKVTENLEYAENFKDELLGKIKDAQELEKIKSGLKSSREKINRLNDNLEIARKGFNNNLFSKQWVLRNAGSYFKDFEYRLKYYEEERENKKIDHKIKVQQEAAKKNRLPENVPNATYLQDMIDEKVCFLCDREFEENDTAHQHLSDLLEKTKKTRVSISEIVKNDFKTFFQNLYNNGYYLKTNVIENVDSSIAKELERIELLEDKKKEAIQEHQLLDQRFKQLLGTSSIEEEESKDIVRNFNQYDKDKGKFERLKFEIEQRLSSNRKELKEILEKMRHNIGESINPDTVEKKEVLEVFFELAKSTRSMVYEEQIHRIEEEANKHFKKMTAENKSVQGKIILKKIGSNYMPKNVDENGIELTSINDSNIILIKLATIMAIVTAKGKSEFHPLISDAPTSKFGDNYTIGFCNTIDNVFAQSIILSYDFYHNMALRKRLLDEVDNLGAVYVIEPSIREEDRANRKELSTNITLLN